MDSGDNGLGRSGGPEYLRYDDDASESVIRADIAWRGRNPRRAVAPKTAAQTGLQIGAFARPAGAEGPPLDAVIIGTSPRAAELRAQIRLYAECDAPVLVTGETGAGKELIARELHRHSARRGRPFVALNAGAVPENLAAAEFFGHTKGAFTGAIAEREGAFSAADGGVLFLDEIGDMPLSVQTQLLRVLDDGVVMKVGSRIAAKTDIRLIAATNVDLSKNVASGAFRRDLYYRINVLTIDAPPLRERGDDIIEIAEHFIATQDGAPQRAARLTPKAADKLRAYSYPGNIRELRNVVQRALVQARGGKILAEHVALTAAVAGARRGPVDATEAKELIGRFAVVKALKMAGGNVAKAAELAGRSRSSVHAMAKEFGEGGATAEYERLRAELRTLIDD